MILLYQTCSAPAAVLCREHEMKSVSTTPQSSNNNAKESSRNTQSYSKYDLFRKTKKNQIISVKRLREQKECHEKFLPKKGHYLSSCQSWAQQESNVLNIQKRCFRLDIRKKFLM